MAQSPKKDDDHRGLKFIVLSLGVLLIGGTILLFVGIVQKMQKQEKAETDYSLPKDYRDCRDATIALGEEEVMEDYIIEGRIMHVISSDAGQTMHVRLIDLCGGRQINHMTIETQDDYVMPEEMWLPLPGPSGRL